MSRLRFRLPAQELLGILKLCWQNMGVRWTPSYWGAMAMVGSLE